MRKQLRPLTQIKHFELYSQQPMHILFKKCNRRIVCSASNVFIKKKTQIYTDGPSSPIMMGCTLDG